jgi:hypothetical protein
MTTLLSKLIFSLENLRVRSSVFSYLLNTVKILFGQLVELLTQHPTVALYWAPGHAGVRGNEMADKLAMDDFFQNFVGSEPFLGVSRQNVRRKIKTLDGQPAFGNVAWSL